MKYDAAAFRKLADGMMNGSEPGDRFRLTKYASCLEAAVDEAERLRAEFAKLEDLVGIRIQNCDSMTETRLLTEDELLVRYPEHARKFPRTNSPA